MVELAHTYRTDLLFIASYAHVQSNPIGGEWKYVDADKEAVDLYIVNHAKRHDIVVTQDTALASILLKSGVYVISPRGKQYSEEDMNTVLFFRYVSAKERRAGRYPKGPKSFTEEDRQRFRKSLSRLLSKLAGI
ncbi:DUF188 domain-containing protein [Bacillus sp. CGMCC 1.16541]|uniref:DUF188 domain-containing protein n=1 Tax=Bacillus sp. CGMCC 1.16541 TaxID=2185143 RepID=UPI000D7342B1